MKFRIACLVSVSALLCCLIALLFSEVRGHSIRKDQALIFSSSIPISIEQLSKKKSMDIKVDFLSETREAGTNNDLLNLGAIYFVYGKSESEIKRALFAEDDHNDEGVIVYQSVPYKLELICTFLSNNVRSNRKAGAMIQVTRPMASTSIADRLDRM